MQEKSNTERGREYEQFVQMVYESVIAAEGVENIDVRHNIVLEGKSGCEHQIDVYWEFRVAGQVYRTAIECKAFNQAVPIGRIRDFQGVLIDVPNLKGIFATLVGFQGGAKKYAEHYGISLQEVRAPKDADWKGRVRHIEINLHVIQVKVTSFQPQATAEFLSTLAPGERRESKLGFSAGDKIFFGADDQAYSYNELVELLPHENEAAAGLKHDFALPGFEFRAGDVQFPVDGVAFGYDVVVTVEHTGVDGDKIIKAVMRDVASGQWTAVDKDGGVRKPK